MIELLVVGGVLAGGYALSKAIKNERERAHAKQTQAHSEALAAAAVRWRLVRAQTARRQAAREMQLAIQQLAHSPDFRRAASFAAQAVRIGVPVVFRQRQFRRLRSLLVEHLAQRIQAGASREEASAGLRELVTSLGVAAYEADYIVSEAEGRRRPVSRPTPSYRDRLHQLHAEHAQRLEAIRNTADLETELREQLIEAEHERFRREVLDEPDQRSGS